MSADWQAERMEGREQKEDNVSLWNIAKTVLQNYPGVGYAMVILGSDHIQNQMQE